MRNRRTAIILVLLLAVSLLPHTVWAAGATPVAVRDSYVAAFGTPLSVPAGSGLLVNDYDPDTMTTGTGIVVLGYSQPAHGTVSVVTNGAFTYTPNAGFAGTDTFTYDIQDTTPPPLTSSFVPVTITVLRSRPPFAEPDNYVTTQNVSLNIPAASGLLINDMDPNGDSITVDGFSFPAHGTNTVVTNGAFTYVPNTNYLGVDTFIYRIKDSHGLFSPYITVTINIVAPGGSAPIAVPDNYATLQNSALTVTAAAGLLTNDFSPLGHAITVLDSNSVPLHGAITLVTNGVFTYTPNNNYVGTDSFTYRVKDTTTLATSGFVSVVITVLPGSNVDTVGVFRPSTATFYLRNSNTTGNADIQTTFGAPTDLPVVGDWNGDGLDTIGIYRPSTSQFFLTNSNTQGAPVVYSLVLGNPGDLPMAGDWDGNGADGVGVFRPSNGLIYLKNDLTTGFADINIVFGIANDKPVAGHWAVGSGNSKPNPTTRIVPAVQPTAQPPKLAPTFVP
ncbi:MAG: Ig-like domain-containing protein [Chloroflexota bacterium]